MLERSSINPDSEKPADIMDERTCICIGAEICYSVVVLENILDPRAKVGRKVPEVVGSIVEDTDPATAVIVLLDHAALLIVRSA